MRYNARSNGYINSFSKRNLPVRKRKRKNLFQIIRRIIRNALRLN